MPIARLSLMVRLADVTETLLFILFFVHSFILSSFWTNTPSLQLVVVPSAPIGFRTL